MLFEFDFSSNRRSVIRFDLTSPPLDKLASIDDDFGDDEKFVNFNWTPRWKHLWRLSLCVCVCVGSPLSVLFVMLTADLLLTTGFACMDSLARSFRHPASQPASQSDIQPTDRATDQLTAAPSRAGPGRPYPDSNRDSEIHLLAELLGTTPMQPTNHG